MVSNDDVKINPVLACVEKFLLPSVFTKHYENRTNNFEEKTKWDQVEELFLTPRFRLDQICYQVSVADHIRSMQTMYKDMEDEQYLGKELRQDISDKLPAKCLHEQIIQGQARIIALCRISYGEFSLETLRATLDIAHSYAQNGMWTQVKDQIENALFKLNSHLLSSAKKKEFERNSNLSQQSATRVFTVFKILRNHAIRHNGYISIDIVNEFVSELKKLSNDRIEMTEEFKLNEKSKKKIIDKLITSNCFHSTQFAIQLHEYFSTLKYNIYKKEDKNDNVTPSCESPELTSSSHPDRTWAWGDLVDFLRYDCSVMVEWINCTENWLLPQQRAALKLGFSQCDPLRRGTALHADDLGYFLNYYPSAAKVICNSMLSKKLLLIPTKISLQHDKQRNRIIGSVIAATTSKVPASGAVFGGSKNKNHKMTTKMKDFPDIDILEYKLPITWEELVSLLVMDETRDRNVIYHQHAQLLTLQGVHDVFCGKVTAAEEHLTNSLTLYKELGLDSGLMTCELYNSIAQMLIVKYRQSEDHKRGKVKRVALKWLATDSGRVALKEQILVTKRLYTEKTGNTLPPLDAEAKARHILLRRKVKEIREILAREGIESAVRMVDAASKYLIRSYEIVEATQSALHPAAGTGCLAIASVLSMACKYGDAREWLIRAIRNMEKQNPVPRRALAAAQLQLSQVMQKGGYSTAALEVVEKVANFYINNAKSYLSEMKDFAACLSQPLCLLQMDTPHTLPLLSKVYAKLKSSRDALQPYSDLATAFELLSQLTTSHASRGNKWRATDFADIAAGLAEMAFGKVSPEAGQTRREAGARCMAIGDYSRAAAHFRRSLCALELLHGGLDGRVLQGAALLHTALEAKNQLFSAAAFQQPAESEGGGLELVNAKASGRRPEEGQAWLRESELAAAAAVK